MKRVYGFTIIELMVTMFVLAIIVAAAAPAFNNVMKNVEVDSSVSSIRSGLSYARSTAVSEQSEITICSTDDQSSCADSNDWESGWLVFEDLDSDGAVDTNETIKRVWGALPTGATLATTVSSLTFDHDGTASSAATLTLKVDDCGTDDMRSVAVSVIGRVAITSGNCS